MVILFNHRKPILFLAFFLTICLLSSKAFALTYYVDATLGNNSWSGTQSNPWKTIAKVNSMPFNPGDQILFKRGETWRETLDIPSSGNSTNQLTFGAYGTGAKPKIMGSAQVSGWDQSPINGTPLPSGCWKASCATDPGGGDGHGPVWFIKASDGKTYWGKEETVMANCNAEYDWYWHPSGYLVIYSPTGPNTRYTSVEAAARMFSILSDWNTHYITISGFEACFTSRETISDQYHADYWIVDGNTVHHSGNIMHWAGDCIYWEGTGWQVRNNLVYEGGAHGIHHYATSNASGDIIENNEVYNCYHVGIDTKQAGPGVVISNQTIRYNKIYSTADYADPAVTMAAISCQSDYVGCCNDIKIYYNLIYNIWNGGIHITYYANQVKVYNNIIAGNHPSSPSGGWGIYLAADDNTNKPTNVVMKNNIIAGSFGAGGMFIDYATSFANTTDCNKNFYYVSGGSGVYIYHNQGVGPYYSNDFNAWKTDTSLDANSLWEDPKFVNPSNLDFHLQSTSPAIDAGADVGLTRDYEGNTVPLGAAPDIGAYEYVSVSGPKTYYVSTTGNNSNPGTQALPWKTIQKAANNMSAGDTVIVLAGNYSGERVLIRRSGSAGAPITFQANGNVIMKGFDVDANYTTIKGFNITATIDRWDDGWGIFAMGHHNIFENNYIYFCIMGGIQLYVEPTDTTKTNNCIIRNNKLNRNGMNGISVMGRDNIIEGNEIWDTIQHHPNHAGNESWLDADGMHFFGSGHVFRKNYIHNITWGAPWNVDPHTDCWQHWSADGFEAASNILFEQNYCDLTTAYKQGQGWMIEPGSGGYRPSNITMRNNIVKVFRDVNAIGVDGITIVGNTFLNDPSFIAYPNPGGIHLQDFTNAIVKNNILYDMINHPICFTGSGYESAQTGGNLEYRSDGQALWINNDWCHYNATHRARDLWGVDPKFVNPATGDYYLQSDSPAINAGYNLTGLVTDDYDGNARPQGTGYDIGAFEYTGGQPPQPIPGDLNNDTRVDIIDLGIIATHFGQTNAHPQWNATADAVMSNEIDIYDIVFVASRFT